VDLNSRHGVTLSIALPFLACSPTGAERPTRAPDVAIVDVNLIPMDSERVLSSQTVLVTRGLISRIGPTASLEVPRGARRIEGGGRYLLPGLVDAHVHLRDTTELLSYLAYGVTSVIHLSGPMGNVPNVLDLRGRVASGSVIGPTIYTTGRILDGDPPINPGVSVPIRTAQDARTTVRDQIEAGVDFVKVYNNLSTAAVGAAVASAHRRGVAVFGHVPRAEGRSLALQAALEAGLDVVAHGEEYFFTFFYDDVERQLDKGEVPKVDEGRIPEAVRLTKAAGVAVTPNLSFVSMTRAQLDDLKSVLDDPEIRFLDPDVLSMWKRRNPTTRSDLDRFGRRETAKYAFLQRLTLALSDAGVPLLLGTDASTPGLFPGKSAHVELRELVKAGLTPYQALAAGTRSAGAFIAGHTHTRPFGTIVPGSRADLLLFRRNPLEDIANIDELDGVLVRGTWFTMAELQRRREKSALTRAM